MKRPTKIAIMYKRYGECEGATCGECCNLITYTNADGKRARKCREYGVSSGEDTNWTARWTACGMWGMKGARRR